MKPFLSIVTVCLNSEKTIARTLQSVLDQAHRDYEYHVIDGGSGDGTLGIVEDYAKKFGDIGVALRLVSESDRGIYDAMNKGIALSKGAVVGIINSDDFYEPDCFSRVEEAYHQVPGAAVYYGLMRVLFKGRELMVMRFNYDAFLLDLEAGLFTSGQHAACFVRRQAYEDIGMYDLQFDIAADYDFLVRVAKNHMTFCAIDSVLANFSRGGASDRMKDSIRYRQRYGIWYKNGLISKPEFAARMKQTKYTYLKEFKTRLVKKVFGFS